MKSAVWTLLFATAIADWVQLPVMAPHDKATEFYLEPHQNNRGVVATDTLLGLKSPTHPEAHVPSDSSLHEKHQETVASSVQKLSTQSSASQFLNSGMNHGTLTESNLEIPTPMNLSIETTPKPAGQELPNLNTQDLKPLATLVLEETVQPSLGSPVSFSELPIEVLKAVHRTLMQETPYSANGKMKFLQRLKNKIMHFVEKRIKRLWTSDERQGRGDKGMGFPSMEGSLMSISFLIFAVYLIKLVQQLIQSLQGNSANMMMMATTARPATGGRRRRSVGNLLATARTLRLMDDFQFRYNEGL